MTYNATTRIWDQYRCTYGTGVCFVAASCVFIRRDVAGVITSISHATNLPVVVYLLSNKNASVSITIELKCDEHFCGKIKVSSWF